MGGFQLDRYLEELDPLLGTLGAGVGHPQDPELGPEQIGSVFLD